MTVAFVEFPNYYFNLSVCAASRVTFFTGLRAAHHGVLGNSLALDWAAAGGADDAIGVWLQDAGYHTTMLGKYLNRVVTDTYEAPGYDDFRGMVDDSYSGGAHAAHVMSYGTSALLLAVNGVFTTLSFGDAWSSSSCNGATTAASNARAAAASTSYQSDYMNRRALNTIADNIEPFYLDLAAWAPHGAGTESDPDHVPIPALRHAGLLFAATHNPSWNEADVSDKPKWLRDTVPVGMTGDEQIFADQYDIAAKRTMRALDELLYDVVRALTAAGKIDRTLIIVTADNGAMIGEHRLTFQTAGSVKNVAYEASSHSRLFVHYPTAVPAGGRPNVIILKLDDTAPHHFDAMPYLQSLVVGTNEALVSTVDICPTICEVARARPSIRPDGMSIVPLLDGRIAAASFRDHLLLECDPADNASIVELPKFDAIVKADGRKYVKYDAKDADPAEVEYYDAAAVAADELVASSLAQPDLDAAIAGMLAG